MSLSNGLGVTRPCRHPSLYRSMTSPRRCPCRRRCGGKVWNLWSTSTTLDSLVNGNTAEGQSSEQQVTTGNETVSIDAANNTTTTTTTVEEHPPSPPQALLASLFGSSSKSSDEPLRAQDPSDQLYSAADWLHNIKSLPGSLILRAIGWPILWVTAWAGVVSVVHEVLPPLAAARWSLSDRPHAFLASALGLLLVFRTNSAYQVSGAEREREKVSCC